MSAKRKLLVTGANGFVAGSVMAQAGTEWEMHALSRSEPGGGTSRSARTAPHPGPLPIRWGEGALGSASSQAAATGFSDAGSPGPGFPSPNPIGRGVRGEGQERHWHTCDPSRRDELSGILCKVKPDVVIHTAAIADIDLAEQNRELARVVNVEFTRSLVDFCKEMNGQLVFCSTDTIFDGEHAPYGEGDRARPVNYYGETKVEAEKIVRTLEGKGLIVRLALVVGLPVMGSGNSFLARMVSALKEGRELKAPEEEVRTPVDVITAGRALLELAAGDQHGVIHLAGNDRLNRIEMGKQIAKKLGLDAELIVPQVAADFSKRARRPRDVSLENAKARSQLKTPMRSFDEGLALILERAGRF